MLLHLFAVICFALYFPTYQAAVIAPNKSENVSRSDNLTSLVPRFHYGNKSYYMGVHMKVNFLQAKQFCANIDMKLLSIESQAENDRIYKQIREINKGDEYWSSGSRMIDGKEWIWMTTGQKFEFSKWAVGQPDSPVDQCVLLTHQKNVGLFWNDRDCNVLAWFICDKEFEEGKDHAELRVSGLANPIQISPLWPNIKLLHFKEKSYYFSRQFKGTFLQAVEFCQMIKMQLVTITSEEENSRLHKYIRDTIAGDNWWTSGSRILDGERWVWMSTGKQVEYTNWLLGQPDNANDLCIHLIDQRNNGLFWNDNNCNNVFQAICEAPNADYNPIDERRTKKGVYYDDYWGGDDWRPRIDDENFGNDGDSEMLRRMRRVSRGSIHMTHLEGRTFHVETELEATQAEAAKFCNYHNMQLLELSEKNKDIVKRLLADAALAKTYWIADSRRFWRNRHLEENNDRSCMVIDKYLLGRIQFCGIKNNFICETSTVLPVSRYQQPVINVFVSNNVVKGDGTIKKLSENLYSLNNFDVVDGELRVNFNSSFDVLDENYTNKTTTTSSSSTPELQ